MKIFIAFLVVFLSFSDARHTGDDSTIKTGFRTVSSLKKVGKSYTDPATGNVSVSVTWSYDSGAKVSSVALVANNLNSAQYAAFGLGQNKSSMGETHVFMCKRLADNSIVLNRYINPGGHEHPQHAGSEDGGVLTLGPQTFSQGVVTCQFNLSNFASQPLGLPKALLPLTQTGSYYPLFAVGVLLNTSEPYYHGNDSRTIVQDTVQLNQNTIINYRLSNPDADGLMTYSH